MKNLLYSVMFLTLVGYAGNKINSTSPEKETVTSSTGKIAVHPKVSGYVDKVYVQEGDYVTADQPLVTLKNQGCPETVNVR